MAARIENIADDAQEMLQSGCCFWRSLRLALVLPGSRHKDVCCLVLVLVVNNRKLGKDHDGRWSRAREISNCTPLTVKFATWESVVGSR